MIKGEPKRDGKLVMKEMMSTITAHDSINLNVGGGGGGGGRNKFIIIKIKRKQKIHGAKSFREHTCPETQKICQYRSIWLFCE